MPGQNLDAEILIIGGGPAGLTSAIYATRARRKTVLIDKVMPGGQVMNTALIENYPGFPGGINGAKLASRFVEQAKSFGPDIRMDEAVEIDIEQDAFIVKTYSGQITAAAVIIASGALPHYSSPRPAPRRKNPPVTRIRK